MRLGFVIKTPSDSLFKMLRNSGIRAIPRILREYYQLNYYSNDIKTAQSAAKEDGNINELKQSHIDDAIALQPLLSTASKQIWAQTHEVFINHGMTTKAFLEIIVRNPAVLARPPKRNIESMENWRSCQFGENLLHILLTTYPELLNVRNERLILERITFLKGFVTTNKNVWKLLMSCPNLFEEREQSIEEKMNYMLKTMRVETHEVVKSQALSKSLDEIRCRHVFLERLNLFTPRSLREDARKPVNNSLLHVITDTSDKNFAVNVARVSLEEYEAFKELFAKELERKRRIDGDEEDEDD